MSNGGEGNHNAQRSELTREEINYIRSENLPADSVPWAEGRRGKELQGERSVSTADVVQEYSRESLGQTAPKNSLA